MIAFVLALLMMIVIIMGIIGFITWAIREHLTARKYRYLIKIHNEMPVQTAHISNMPRWSVTYLVKGKKKTETVEAKTEGEAVRSFVGSKIIEVVKL